MQYSLKLLLIVQLVVGLYFSLMHWAWKSSSWVDIRINDVYVWNKDGKRFWIREEPVLAVTFYKKSPLERHWSGFPRRYGLSSTTLKNWYRPNNLEELKPEAQRWVVSEEGRRSIQNAEQRLGSKKSML